MVDGAARNAHDICVSSVSSVLQATIIIQASSYIGKNHIMALGGWGGDYTKMYNILRPIEPI